MFIKTYSFALLTTLSFTLLGSEKPNLWDTVDLTIAEKMSNNTVEKHIPGGNDYITHPLAYVKAELKFTHNPLPQQLIDSPEFQENFKALKVFATHRIIKIAQKQKCHPVEVIYKAIPRHAHAQQIHHIKQEINPSYTITSNHANKKVEYKEYRGKKFNPIIIENYNPHTKDNLPIKIESGIKVNPRIKKENLNKTTRSKTTKRKTRLRK